MIDSLVQYLLEEIAMDGDEGTSINDLSNFISDFYSTFHHQQQPQQHSTSTSSSPPQLVDEDFLRFIWNTLVDQPDVRVGLLKNLEGNSTSQPQTEEGGGGGGAVPTNEEDVQIEPLESRGEGEAQGEDSDLKPAKKPLRKKQLSTPSNSPTHELTLVPSATSSLGYSHLSNLYASQGELRVVASPETAWKAITGSHSRPTAITPMVYQVLQMVSRGRGEGVTAVTLSRELGVDPKSVFHYIKVPQQLGIVKKISAIDQGSRTNRILHVRYLSTSPHWAIHTASDPTASVATPSNAAHTLDSEETGGGGTGQMSTISALYLSTNPRLVRNRIVRALKARGSGRKGGGGGGDWEGCWMVQSEMASSIGLHSYSSTILRRLNALINGLALEGVLEKIAVTKKNRKTSGKGKGQVESISTVQALRLIDPDKLLIKKPRSNLRDGDEQPGREREEEEEEEEEEEDDHSYPLANRSMQRQILDLLIEADTRGLTGNEICETLGRYNLRTIDATLQRLGRQSLPVDYFDFQTTSLTETVGRMKQTRWFSLGGYISMRRERGLPDEKAEEKWEAGVNAYEERRRSLMEGEGEEQAEGQWLSLEERRKWLKRFRTMDHAGQGLGDGVKDSKRPSSKKSKKASDGDDDEGGDGTSKPRKKPAAARKKKEPTVDRKGKQKATNQDDPGAEDEKADGDSSGTDTPRPIKPRGRPRKHAPVDGKESWYQRKKRLDAERIAQGLDPQESYYARKKREEKEDRDREEAGLPPLVREKPKRTRKSVEPKVEDDDDDDQLDQLDQPSENHSPDTTPAPPPPPPKKRGRPRKSSVSNDDPQPATATPAPVSKKRGRPSKLDKLAAAARELERAERDGDCSAPPVEEENGADSESAVERPKKRTRFSLATTATENAGSNDQQADDGEVQAAPAQPARRRGRSSGPPLVPGPELDGAPVRTPAPSAPPAPPVESTPVKTPSTSHTSAGLRGTSIPRRPTRSVPVVEIEVPPPRRTARERKGDGSASTPTTSQNLSNEAAVTTSAVAFEELNPAPSSPKAPSPPPSTVNAVAGPSQPRQPIASSSPAPHAPSSTPMPSSSQALAGSQPKRSKSRKSVTSKDNLTALSRQKEILDYVTAQGGIIDAVPRLGEYIRDYNRQAKPSLPAFTMDRHVVTSTLVTLVKREHLRKTSTVGVKGERHDIYYFPAIALDSPQMVSFLDKTLQREKTAHWDRFDRPQDIVIDDEAIDETGRASQSKNDQGGGGGAQTTDFPKPQDDPADVKDFFRRQPIVVGASYGARYGAFSRARQLHKWLASFLFSAHPGQFLAASDEHGHILTHETFVAAMPLVVFTSIVPLPIESDELRQFLTDPNNLFLPLSLVPTNIISFLRPSLNKRKQAVWRTITTLMTLHLLSPLVDSGIGGSSREKSFVTPTKPHYATHWRFNATAPVYAFALNDGPLVSVATLDSLESVSSYWTTVQKLATVVVDPLPSDDPMDLARSGFPLKFDGYKSVLHRLRLKSKWKDGYHLLPDQRRFLSDLVRFDPNLVNNSTREDRTVDLEKWADALFAPINVVTEFLRSVERKARRAAELDLNGGRRKRRRVAKKSEHGQGGILDGEEEDEEGWEDVEVEKAGASVDPAASSALHRKVQELAAQRLRDWTTIVDKFRAEQSQPSLDPDILNYLQRRFVDPRRQIDAVQLLYELRQLAQPEPLVAPGDELLRTVVPHNLRRRARQAKDPYAISRQPNIRKRVRSQLSKAAPARPSSARAPSSPPAPRGGRESLEPVEYGDQNEFLSQPALPRPEASAGKRVRNFYTSEQDELLLDAVAVLKARMRLLGTRISYGVLERLFVGHKASVLRSRSIVLLKKPEEQAYHDRLVEAWIQVYTRKKREQHQDANLNDPNPTSMTDFDVASFIRCLRQNVDKRALRLTRSVARAPPPSLILPASLTALRTGYTIKASTSAVSNRASNWDNYWVGAGVATTDRESSIARATIATDWLSHAGDAEKKERFERAADELEEELEFEREQALTAAAIKMVVSSSSESYTPNRGIAVLEPFERHVDRVVQKLKNQRVIISVSSEPGRRIPGRNFSFDDRFYDRLDSTRITMDRLSDAIQFENELRKEQRVDRVALQARVNDGSDGEGDVESGGTSVFPIIPTEGEIMALVDLVSEGKVELSIDTTTLSEKTTRFDDFGTRQANDDDIECTVQIESLLPVDMTTAPSTLPLPEAFYPSSLTNDRVKLELAKSQLIASLPDGERNLGSEILSLVESKGVQGLTLDELCLEFPLESRSNLLSSISTLLLSASSSSSSSSSTSCPLVFLSGFSHPPIYVSSLYLASYSIPLPPSSRRDEEGSGREEGVRGQDETKWIVPCCWTGVEGELNREVWTRSTSFVRGCLYKKTGLTFDELKEKASSSLQPPTSSHDTTGGGGGGGGTSSTSSSVVQILTPLELRVILETLEKNRILQRNPFSSATSEEEVEGGRKSLIDWDKDTWSLSGCFWTTGRGGGGGTDAQ